MPVVMPMLIVITYQAPVVASMLGGGKSNVNNRGIPEITNAGTTGGNGVESDVSNSSQSALKSHPHPPTNHHQHCPRIPHRERCFIQGCKCRAASRFDQYAVVVGEPLAGA